MTEKYPVYRLTQEAYHELSQVIKETPGIYLNPDIDFQELLTSRNVSEITEETDVYSTRPISLDAIEKSNKDDRQALDFYNGFVGLNAREATDEKMWAWMTHFKLHPYALQRWRRQSNTNLPNYLKSHWLTENARDGIWESNAAARTWWIAHTAIQAASESGGAFTAQEALDDYSENAGHYHRLREYKFTRSPLMLAELTRALLNEAKGIKADDGLITLIRYLNRMSGIKLLDVLPRAQLRGIILTEVERIMSDPDLVKDRSKLRNRKPFRSLSLGAGVQSTVLALMADRCEYGLQRPDVAIFADTGWEPPDVYSHLEWLQSELSFEIVKVSAGNIRDNILQGVSPSGDKYLGIPAYVTSVNGNEGIAPRRCTTKYKINPINRYLRERLEIPRGRRAPKDTQVEVWIGISADEAIRQKPSRDEWATNRYPLVELGFSRAQLINWFSERYPDRYLPRSSCIGCPYKNDSEWKRLKEDDPKSFQDAAFIDMALREIPIVRNSIAREGLAYLHRSRTPLADVDFTDAQHYDDAMLEECEGICGI